MACSILRSSAPEFTSDQWHRLLDALSVQATSLDDLRDFGHNDLAQAIGLAVREADVFMRHRLARGLERYFSQHQRTDPPHSEEGSAAPSVGGQQPDTTVNTMTNHGDRLFVAPPSAADNEAAMWDAIVVQKARELSNAASSDVVLFIVSQTESAQRAQASAAAVYSRRPAAAAAGNGLPRRDEGLIPKEGHFVDEVLSRLPPSKLWQVMSEWDKTAAAAATFRPLQGGGGYTSSSGGRSAAAATILPVITPDLIHTAELRDEWRIRAAYMHKVIPAGCLGIEQRLLASVGSSNHRGGAASSSSSSAWSSTMITPPRAWSECAGLPLIPLYDVGASGRLTPMLCAAARRALGPTERQHAIVEPSNSAASTPEAVTGLPTTTAAAANAASSASTPSTATTTAPPSRKAKTEHVRALAGPVCHRHVSSFRDAFDAFTSRCVEGITWDGVYVCGGAVLAAVLRTTSDVDFVPPTLTKEQLDRRSPQFVPYASRPAARQGLAVLERIDIAVNAITRRHPRLLPDILGEITSYLRKPVESTKGFQQTPYDSSDIDVFLCATSEADAKRRLTRLIQELLTTASEVSPSCLPGAQVQEVEAPGDSATEVDEDDDDDDDAAASSPRSRAAFTSNRINVRPGGRKMGDKHWQQRIKGLRLLRSANAITIWSGHPVRNIQVVIVRYTGLHEILSFFDLDCVCLGYNGTNVFALPRAIRALQTGYNFVEPMKLRRWSTGPRILKYTKRGFGTLFFEICKHQPRCDVVLNEEMTLRIAAIHANTSASVDIGYGLVQAPYHAHVRTGLHFDKYIAKQKPLSDTRPVISAAGKIVFVKADASLNAEDKYVVFTGDRWRNAIGPHPAPQTPLKLPVPHWLAKKKKAAAATAAVAPPVEVNYHSGKGDPKRMTNAIMNSDAVATAAAGLPPLLRSKVDDLWDSRRGNEFLPRCYMCGQRIDPTATEKERPLLCLLCDTLNDAKRSLMGDLSGFHAIVTGGRVKIGYVVALRLLRMGASVVVTSRFANDAASRYLQEPDAAQWCTRLFVFGVDFCHPPSIATFADVVRRQVFPARVHLLVNNAAQTILRPADYYQPAAATTLRDHPQVAALCGRVGLVAQITPLDVTARILEGQLRSDTNSGLADSMSLLTGGGGQPQWQRQTVPDTETESHYVNDPIANVGAQLAVQRRGEVTSAEPYEDRGLDGRASTSWSQRVGDVGLAECMASQLVTAIAPMQLIGLFEPLLVLPADQGPTATSAAAATTYALENDHQPSFVINVTSPEGQFSQEYKSDAHPHTNMAKASMNMLTRTVAASFAARGCYVSSVDTGWISRMRQTTISLPPLQLEDGGARVLDPVLSVVLQHQAPRCGVLFRHFEPVPW